MNQKIELKEPENKIKIRSYQEALLNSELEIAEDTQLIVENMQKDFDELNTIFKDFDELTNKQGFILSNVEENVNISKVSVDKAVETLHTSKRLFDF
jgi:hypothetical protein